jgi:X-Pro dipeptidyl-peptidase
MRFQWGLAAATVAVTLSTAPAALAQTAPVIEGGRTQPVFGYADAIREHVIIDSPYDSDKNGVLDKIAIDIKRPSTTNP